jgi:acyl carrier protein
MKLKETVISIVQANTEEKAGVTLASDLRKELHLDSFGTLMIINAIEDAFGVSVDDADFCHVNTVADVVALLQSKYHCDGGGHAAG